MRKGVAGTSKTIDSFFRPAASHARNGASDSRPTHAVVPTPETTRFEGEHEDQLQQGASPNEWKRAESLFQDSGESANLQRLMAVYDIGEFISDTMEMDEYTKFNILTNHWQPPTDYAFPYSVHMKQGKERKRFLNRSHLMQFPWVVLSDTKKGLYCKYCALFAGTKGGFMKNTQLKKLVRQPLTAFAKLLGKDGDLVSHERTSHHGIYAVLCAQDFISTYKKPTTDVRNLVNSQRQEQVKNNRERLIPIIETIIFLARQNIPFRGHRDDGLLSNTSTGNEGNFRELLRFRIKAGDENLKRHVADASRATYISKTTQNAILQCCAEEILDAIRKRVTESRYYSVIFDETTDLAHVSQLSLIIRYVESVEQGNNIREDFVHFLDVHAATSTDDSESEAIAEPRITGNMLGRVVKEALKKNGFSLNDCVGIGTDGCSVMASELRGAVTEIQNEESNAVRCPCYNHALNLSVSKSSRVQCIRNTVGIIKEVVTFFGASAKRNVVLKKVVGHQLTSVCETRWVERHVGVINFKESLPKTVEALQCITEWQESSSSAKAKSLLSSLCDDEFVLSLLALSDILGQTCPLSRHLQKEKLDVKHASDMIQDTISVLEAKRKNSEEEFEKIYSSALELLENMGCEPVIRMPRLTKRQCHRGNPRVESPMQYYRVILYNPLVEHVMEDLKARFPPETLNVYRLNALLRKKRLIWMIHRFWNVLRFWGISFMAF